MFFLFGWPEPLVHDDEPNMHMLDVGVLCIGQKIEQDAGGGLVWSSLAPLG